MSSTFLRELDSFKFFSAFCDESSIESGLLVGVGGRGELAGRFSGFGELIAVELAKLEDEAKNNTLITIFYLIILKFFKYIFQKKFGIIFSFLKIYIKNVTVL